MYTRRARRIVLAGPAMLAWSALVVLLPAAVQSDYGPWSEPAALSACSAPGAPAVLFPTDAPARGTGPGAIVWSSASRCPGGAGPRLSTIALDGDTPGPAFIPRTAAGQALALSKPLTAATAPHGQILLAAPTGQGTGSGRSLLLGEGLAGGPFATGWTTGGASAPFALATAYLGDVAIASPGGYHRGASAIQLRIHRYYAGSFTAPIPVAARPSSSIEGLTLAMDYRSDALAVWERDGAIYARFMPQSDRSEHALTRVASAAPGARIAATLSDDNRAILAWIQTRGGVTSVYAELSDTGVHFGAPRLLERFADPGGTAPLSGSPRLVRLSSESVMLAWTGAMAGQWVVHTAAVDLHGVRTIDTISAPARNALLTALEPGPDGEAYALWSEPQSTPSGLDRSDQGLYAARGIDAYPGQTIFGAPEQVSAPGASGTSGEAAIGVDPDSGRAIAAWRTPGGAIDYSLQALGGA